MNGTIHEIISVYDYHPGHETHIAYSTTSSSLNKSMWEGLVTAADADTFTALIYDLDHPSQIEVGDFKITIINEKDRNLVVPGAIFQCSRETGFSFFPEQKMSEEEFLRVLLN